MKNENTQHTAGPWLGPQDLTDNYIWATKDNVSVVIAKVNIQMSSNPKVVISDKEAMANGSLIARAPELLKENEQLKEYRDELQGKVNLLGKDHDRLQALNAELLEALKRIQKFHPEALPSNVIEIVDSAIAKAEGKTLVV